jgi:cell division protein FtsL
MKHVPLIVILLIVIELVWSNTLVTSGRKVTETDLTITKVRRENEELSQKVASASALTTIAARAKDAGFIEPVRNQFVQINAETLPVALVP